MRKWGMNGALMKEALLTYTRRDSQIHLSCHRIFNKYSVTALAKKIQNNPEKS